LADHLTSSSLPKLNKVVANIPYNITGLILEKLLGTIANPALNSLMHRVAGTKEVAERLYAQPGSSIWSLSVRVQYLQSVS